MKKIHTYTIGKFMLNLTYFMFDQNSPSKFLC